MILGPFKYLPFKKSLGSVIGGMAVHGFGLGASVVGGFSDAHSSAIRYGFPDTIDTYGLVSGLWTSVFAFGAFMFIVGLEMCAIILILIFLCVSFSQEDSTLDRSISTISESDEVGALQPPNYGSTGGVTVSRARKFSEH